MTRVEPLAIPRKQIKVLAPVLLVGQRVRIVERETQREVVGPTTGHTVTIIGFNPPGGGVTVLVDPPIGWTALDDQFAVTELT